MQSARLQVGEGLSPDGTLAVNGDLPTQAQLDSWTHDITIHTFVHENVKEFMQGFRYDAHPMGMLLASVGALSTFYPEASKIKEEDTRYMQVVRYCNQYCRFCSNPSSGWILDLPTAIRKMTSLPAERFGLRDRGVLAVGKIADVVVFDPATVMDRATYEDPLRAPIGVRDVLMNGRPMVTNGVVGRVRGGAVLASGR